MNKAIGKWNEGLRLTQEQKSCRTLLRFLKALTPGNVDWH
jgi:uncharacterized protein YeaC (DUF1315 family)